jgi:hypothetical protein
LEFIPPFHELYKEKKEEGPMETPDTMKGFSLPLPLEEKRSGNPPKRRPQLVC